MMVGRKTGKEIRSQPRRRDGSRARGDTHAYETQWHMSKQTRGQQVSDLDVELALPSSSDLAAAMRRSSPFEARYVRVLKRESTVPGLSGRTHSERRNLQDSRRCNVKRPRCVRVEVCMTSNCDASSCPHSLMGGGASLSTSPHSLSSTVAISFIFPL